MTLRCRGPVWVEPDQPLPDPRTVDAPDGLVAVGIDLSAARLEQAYRLGLFPWSSDPRQVLWFSPDPRMVAFTAEFVPSHSLRRRLRQLRTHGGWTLTLDAAFIDVMRACAAPRDGQDGTWITTPVRRAYTALHRRGQAHSMEVWDGDALIAGLYGVSIGRMFFGESMFTRVSDASKCAYAAMTLLLRDHGFTMVDCQQKTRHLQSLGARVITRAEFLRHIRQACAAAPPDWATLTVGWPEV